jgi:hypothetical protein
MKTLLSILFVIFASIAITAQSTSFTYQGHLDDGNAAANGNYDFEFRLFDASSAGNQQGSTAQRLNVVVANGIFTVQLDFGNSFPGPDRFLEIAVRSGGGPSFTSLSPRQQLASAPYAVKSLASATADMAANAAQLGGLASSQYVQTNDSRLSDARTPTAGSNSYVQNSLAQQVGASFNVSGNGTAGGTLSGNAVNASTQYNIGGQRILSIGGSSNLFAGAGTGFSITTGNNNSFVGANAGSTDSAGSLNSFFGSNAGQANVSGGNNSFFGYHSGFNSTGNNNSFFGSNAGTNNSTGFNNSIFGKDAGFNSGASNNNAFFGYIAGFNNSTGNFNSFFGQGSGQSNTSGTSNTFLGNTAGRDNQAGNQNTFVGSNAGLNNTNGVNNTFVGESSGGNNDSGGGNAFFGKSAGDTNVTGSNNTAIGVNADVLNSNLTNATAIGYQAGVGQSNSLVLGSINGVNGATSDTKVGIGTIFPSERLTIETASNSYGWVHTQGTITMGSYVGGTGAQPFGGWIGTKTNHPLSFFTNNGGAAMTLETSGFLRLNNVDAGGSLSLCLGPSNHISFCSSSLRYKTNIAPFTQGLSLLKQLSPITFNWKEGGMADLGFGAEDVAKANELLVIRNKKGEVEGVKYDRISAVLVNAVKEQQALIEKQKQKLEQLETLVNSLRALICTGNAEAGACKEK